jgi:hypothetical protein
MAQVDGPLLLFFGALFIIIASLDAAGVLTGLSTWVVPWFHAPALLGIAHFAWVSVLASNLVSNVPYVLAAARWVGQGADSQRLRSDWRPETVRLRPIHGIVLTPCAFLGKHLTLERILGTEADTFPDTVLPRAHVQAEFTHEHA